ncbi:MAG: TauD/TfdA family dioxygenase [Gammaproteobacteria bacterium]|nr:TauD/TfdA family dioxygenase [Gammaproteobacteria bacterium]
MQATTISLLDPASVADDGIIRERLPVPLAWTARDLTRDDWLVPLPPECVAELRAVVADLRANPLPTIVLEPDDYELSACRELAERLRQRFHSGMGIAVLDRLPLDELDREEATACYWLLGRLLARPVAQAFDGRLLYDVRDVGRNLRFQEGVRASITTDELLFHSDAAYAHTAPDYLGLLCLQSARAGGISRLVSLLELHNHILDAHPDLLPRCYQPFLFSQGTDHRADDDGIVRAPLFGWGAGGFRARIHNIRIERGYQRAAEVLDPAGRRVLDVIEAFLADRGNWFDMQFEPGQIQFVNNRTIGHSRTAFDDWPEPERKRHLVRLWLRDHGRRSFYG